MKLRTLVLALSVLFLGSACVASIGNRRAEGSTAKASGEKPDDKDDAAEKLRKKERELAYAKVELDIARVSAEADERSAENDWTEASQKLELAQKDLANFQSLEMPTKIADKQLDLDRAQQRMRESEQELHELEAMYKQEDFASLTKELVLDRGRKNLEFARRGFELAKKGQEELTGHELPKKEKELTQAVERTEKAVREATAKKGKTGMEGRLKVLKAEHQIDELEREVAKLKDKEKEKGKEKEKVAEAG